MGHQHWILARSYSCSFTSHRVLTNSLGPLADSAPGCGGSPGTSAAFAHAACRDCGGGSEQFGFVPPFLLDGQQETHA